MAVIGDLVARLTADTRQFDSGMQSARTTLGDVVSAIGRVPFATTAAIGATVIAVRKMTAAFGESVDAARVQETAERKLASVIKATGQAAGIGEQGLKDYAAQLQEVTNFGDEETIEAMAKLLTFKDIKGDTFKRVLEGAQDITAVFGGDLSENVEKFALAIDDPIKGLGALSKRGFKFTDEQKRMMKQMVATGDVAGAQAIIFEELEGQIGGAAKGMADPMTQLSNVFGDIKENIGFALLPSIKEISTAFMRVLSPAQSATDSFKDMGESIADMTRTAIVPLIEWFGGMIAKTAEVTDAIAFGFRNASDLAQLALVEMRLAAVDLLPEFEDTFGNIIATMNGVWSGTQAVFFSFIDAVKGGFEELINAARAVASGVMAAFDAIKRGENPLTALVDEFSSTLAAQQDVQAPNILKEFGDAFTATRNEMLEQFASDGGFGASLRKQRDELLANMAQREALRIEPPEPAAMKAVLEPFDEALGRMMPKLAGVLARDSADAISAINKSMLGGAGGKEPIEEVADINREQLAEQKRMTAELSRQARERPIIYQV